MKEPEDFSADDYRAMAARFSMCLTLGALTVREWCPKCGDDGDYVPSSDERKVVNMLLKAAEMKEREENQ